MYKFYSTLNTMAFSNKTSYAYIPARSGQLEYVFKYPFISYSKWIFVLESFFWSNYSSCCILFYMRLLSLQKEPCVGNRQPSVTFFPLYLRLMHHKHYIYLYLLIKFFLNCIRRDMISMILWDNVHWYYHCWWKEQKSLK